MCAMAQVAQIANLFANTGRDEMAIFELRTEPGLLIAAWVCLHIGHLALTARESCKLVCGFTKGAERTKLTFC